MDAGEYAQQMQGLATALEDPEVTEVLIGAENASVALAIFEWSGRFQQELSLEWTIVDSLTTLKSVTGKLRARTRSTQTRPTAIGHALGYAARLFNRAPKCAQYTLDVSGDGKNNDGYRPRHAYQIHNLNHVTVNALVIGSHNIAELTAYFSSEVIRGPNAFVETALGFEAYPEAMKRKLLRELSVLMLSNAANTGRQTALPRAKLQAMTAGQPAVSIRSAQCHSPTPTLVSGRETDRHSNNRPRYPVNGCGACLAQGTEFSRPVSILHDYFKDYDALPQTHSRQVTG